MKTSKREIPRIVCRECGIGMNRHAAKIVEPRTREEAEASDQSLGGIVAHVHTCPSCGTSECTR